MNVRLADPCRESALELSRTEIEIKNVISPSVRPGSPSPAPCTQEIFLGFYFDGTNNNKYRDTPGQSQSNVARLFEACPGTPSSIAATYGGQQDRVFQGGVPAAELKYYRKTYIPGLGTAFPEIKDTGEGWWDRKGGLAAAIQGEARGVQARLQASARALLVATTLTLLAACGQQGVAASATATTASQPAADTVSAAVYSLNYSHQSGFIYTVYDKTVPGLPAIGGAAVYPLGGGDQGCCISLPKTWRPGMAVLLKWQADDTKQTSAMFERELEIPQYAEAGDLYVVFDGTYAAHQVELLVSRYGPGHPQWPGRIKQEPMAHCMATEANQKLCSRWTVKGLTEFTPEDWLKDCDLQNLDEGCRIILDRCIADHGVEACSEKHVKRMSKP